MESMSLQDQRQSQSRRTPDRLSKDPYPGEFCGFRFKGSSKVPKMVGELEEGGPSRGAEGPCIDPWKFYIAFSPHMKSRKLEILPPKDITTAKRLICSFSTSSAYLQSRNHGDHSRQGLRDPSELNVHMLISRQIKDIEAEVSIPLMNPFKNVLI